MPSSTNAAFELLLIAIVVIFNENPSGTVLLTQLMFSDKKLVITIASIKKPIPVINFIKIPEDMSWLKCQANKPKKSPAI